MPPKGLRRIDLVQVEDIVGRLDELKIRDTPREHIRYALSSKYAEGDIAKAIELIRLQQEAFAGIIAPYNPHVRMLGAENRGAVTCYLDSLLFAMFSKIEAFECMLKNDLADEPQRNLAALIRLWVNMLRSGKLIRTDMVCIPSDAVLVRLEADGVADRTPARRSSSVRVEGRATAGAAGHLGSVCFHHRNPTAPSPDVAGRPLPPGQGRRR